MTETLPVYGNIRPYTDKEMREGLSRPIEPGYPPNEHRLWMSPGEWRKMINRGIIEIPDSPLWHIDDHPHRKTPQARGKIDPIVTPENPMSEARVERWRERGLLVDTLGRPLHPRASQLLTARGVGMFTGPGYGYRYGPALLGNLGARTLIKGVPHYVFTGVMRPKLVYGLPGGYAERRETGAQAAFREAYEEANILFTAARKRSLQQRVVRIAPGGFRRATLHSWLDERFLFVWERPGEERGIMRSLELGTNDAAEVQDVRWIGMPEIEAAPDTFIMKDHRKAVLEHEAHLQRIGVG